tara:strand:+ start:679 stop:1548 length:870 start_codon:yes stop_codon:yes gene_type:complete
MGDDITHLSAYLTDLGITGTSITEPTIRDLISNDISGNNRIIISTNIDLRGLKSLNKIDNLLLLTQLGLLDINSQTITSTFTADNLLALDNKSLTHISLLHNNICVKKEDEPLAPLNKVIVDYVNLNPSLSNNDKIIRLASIGDSVENTICSGVVNNKHFHATGLDPCDPTKCSSGGGGDCITSVSISGTSLVIQTGPCGGTSTILNTPVSDSTDVSYTKCTNCGNSKTLLRNEVDEVVDDSSALYNRDSNNEVCNHCLVSIGDEKHCNRFLDKEDCNYLGDSYAWVGA